MKQFYISVVFLVFSFIGLSQEPNPELFKTWYLYSVEADLGGTDFYYGEDVPQMTINQNLSFTAADNCWALNGNFEYTPYEFGEFGLQTINYNKECVLGGSSDYILEEIFMFPNPALCFINETNNSTELTMETNAGFIYAFKSEPTLSNPENIFSTISVFPNPTSEKLSIPGDVVWRSAKIYNLQGRLMLTTEKTNTIDVSSMANGMYFLQVALNSTTQVIKFIKE